MKRDGRPLLDMVRDRLKGKTLRWLGGNKVRSTSEKHPTPSFAPCPLLSVISSLDQETMSPTAADLSGCPCCFRPNLEDDRLLLPFLLSAEDPHEKLHWLLHVENMISLHYHTSELKSMSSFLHSGQECVYSITRSTM